MSRLFPHRPHPPLSGADLEYVRNDYLTIDELARRQQLAAAQLAGWIEDGRLPRPSYLLPDGTPVFPADLLALVNAAGSLEALPQHFAQRTELAARMAGMVPNTRESDWEDYLSGEYGICLRQVTPETLVLKELLVERIGQALEDPHPEDLHWRHALTFQIDGLDALVRPFTAADRVRFGRATSRERLIEVPRRRWAWLRETQGPGPADSLSPDSAAPAS